MVKVLLCEDEKENVDSICNLLNKLKDDYSLEFDLCHFETREDCLKSLSNNFELCIIDIKLPINAVSNEIDDNAGIRIMDAIVNEYFNDKGSPIPIFQFTNYHDDFMNSFKGYASRFSGEYFIYLPFKSKPDVFIEKNIGLFLDSLELVQFSRIRHIDNTAQWIKLLDKISKRDYSGQIIFDNKEWEISDFVFPETTFSNRPYFKRSKIIDEIIRLINNEKGPKKGIWDRNPNLVKKHGEDTAVSEERQRENRYRAMKLHEIAKKLMENDDSKQTIEKTTESWLEEIKKIVSNDYSFQKKEEWRAITDPFGKKACKNNICERLIVNKLVWRRLVINIIHSNDLSKSIGNDLSKIVTIEKYGKMNSSLSCTEGDIKKFCYNTGFEKSDNIIRLDNLFNEEEILLNNL